MRLVNNNISPLPFYDDISLQNHRRSYAYGSVYPLIVPRQFLIPFQVPVTATGAEGFQGGYVKAAYLVNFNTDQEIDIFAEMNDAGLTAISYETFLLVKYPALMPISSIKLEGRYYLKILVYLYYGSGATLQTLYSDIFTAVNSVDEYISLEYSNSYNFEFKNGVVDFSDGFRFKCYLSTEIGKPEYQFEEEVSERMGYSFIESQVSKKVYKFTFIAPEYLCDALRLVRLCENKLIKAHQDEYELTLFNMNPTWEEQGDLASVECEFETDTVIANIGGFEPVKLGGLGADFNADFNADFDVES